ncbi:Endomembrane protein 70 family protein [Candida parapsilosis]|uniref:Transmembrane 9 superfamily member n=2 Tax=Candida parapsilosis TaxID=5480 RepID=G8BCA0_CANPC|nr:uncharacterized protein CPAR2_803160 [Candida parapsilosis]KAF6051664.1 Endomembrane protein 70 family protein [Candida parapsilosis]KAF6052839.1 Endomembrane protein 70 family protein [Candida parapsilosis]KAF6053466.1 Endomembrane protein 70 family protein [Candida parapsilosis]KAF6064616.1 Endomembrane protein 70 family protein [Candida parapsilosis]KAI5909811.1 Transmembrane 9 superfamily member 3 [Candida parapsilosis]
MKLHQIHYLLILLLTPCIIHCHILDLGLKPNYYQIGDPVDLLVNKIESDKTQLPFAYYSLTFVCPPMNNAKPVHLSLGEILRGDRIWQSGYDLRFGIDQPCLRLCDLLATQAGIRRASNLIKDGYVVHWSIDGLPGATTFETNNHRRKYYAAGFPMGFVDQDVSYLYNHVMLVIRYHREANTGKYTIVGFEVYPKSVINEECPGTSKNYRNFPLLYKVDDKGQLASERTTISYTYSVYWREDKSIDYESRWDLYYENESGESQSKIHWISFVNSTVLIFLASLIVMIVMVQVLKKDIRQQSPSLPISEGDVTGNAGAAAAAATAATGGGWKNLANKVNIIPRGELLLTTLVSGGVQMLIAIVGVVVISSLNSIKSKNYFFNNHQGALFSFAIFCFMGSGLVSSFLGIVLHKLFRKETNQKYGAGQILILSLLFSAVVPAFLFILMFILNFFVWAQDSSTALPFGTIVVFVLLFILIQCPLGIIGGIYGNKYKFNPRNHLSICGEEEKLQPPHDGVKCSGIKSLYRLVSPVSYLKTVTVFGLIPFGIVYVELLFVFNSVWLEKTTFYYMYGFLFITTVMLLIIIIELTIVAIYVSLVYYNDANWTWLSFKVGSSIAWYIYGYSIYYFITVLNIDDFVSSLLYFSYMGLACFIIGIACGAVGVITGLLFIRKIYGAVKLE